MCGRPSPRNWPVKVPERRIARYASGGRLDTILGCTAIAAYGQIHLYFSATVHNNAEQAALSGTVGKDRDLGSLPTGEPRDGFRFLCHDGQTALEKGFNGGFFARFGFQADQ